jgi:hypothetical protein
VPRGRGGARQGVIGKGYQNRTDLNGANSVSPQPPAPGRQPITAVPGQQYGAATAQKNAQRLVPMSNTPLNNAPLNIQLGGGPQSAPQGTPPGGLGDLTAQTDRPDEHLMTGVNAGPGAGTEALTPMTTVSPVATALSLLNMLGDNVSPQVAHVRNTLALQQQNESPF